MAENPEFAHRATTGYTFRIESDGVAEVWNVAIDNLKDAEAKLANTATELHQTKKLLRELQGQNDELRKQVTATSQASSKHEENCRRKEGELSALMADVPFSLRRL